MIIICVELIYLIRNGHTLVRWSRRTFSQYLEHQNYILKTIHIVCEANCQSKHKNVKTLLVSTPKNVSNEEIKYFQILER